MRPSSRAVALARTLLVALIAPRAAWAQQAAPVVPNPGARDMFQLNDLASYRQFSTVKNFEIVGHSYFRGAWLVPGAPGAGFNTMRICDTIRYFAGYNPTLFRALIVAVGNPAAMEPLSFIAGNPGTRNAYLRVDCDRKILALGHSASPENPNKPTGGAAVKSGVTLHDVSDPRRPVKVAEWNNTGG